jgi:hypothetical protein
LVCIMRIIGRTNKAKARKHSTFRTVSPWAFAHLRGTRGAKVEPLSVLWTFRPPVHARPYVCYVSLVMVRLPP